MEEHELREQVAKRLALYRKQFGMTQFELAQKINYSDKSVSKWERGDGLPDLFVIYQIAELFGITADALIYGDADAPTPCLETDKWHEKFRRLTKTLLAVGLVWLCGTVIYFLMNMAVSIFSVGIQSTWLTFLYCVPVSCVVLIVLTKLWWNPLSCFFSVTGLVWTAPLSLYLTFSRYDTKNMFLICAVMQVLVVLWFIMRYYHPSKRKR
ncbi:MAG: helix-turn-helix transcriptional regulator [Clostridiales bacterium]|jgi:transcriptional regulator with XRE-family HTH domain|nr:helix-turn-helix transcriptional regulator [Clostridiales bacterium]